MIMRAKQLEHELSLCWSGCVGSAGDSGEGCQHNQPRVKACWLEFQIYFWYLMRCMYAECSEMRGEET